ncbi:MAG: type II secretion system protein N [Marinicellaceae bacterium]
MANYKLQLVNFSHWIIIALILFLWVQFALFRDSTEDFDTRQTSNPMQINQVNVANNSIANFHIFGTAEKLYDIPLTQAQTSLKLTLNGTMNQSDSSSGLAYISNVQGEQNKFKVGDKVFDNATLVEIHKTHVILDNRGKREKLSLPEKLANTNQNNNTRNSGNKAAISKHLNGGNQNWQELMDKHRLDPNNISNIVNNVNLVTDQVGTIKGIRVSNLSAGAIDLGKVGLKKSDIITAVNGNKVSGKNLFEIGKTIQDNPNTVVTIQRNGKVHNIQININDLNQ